MKEFEFVLNEFVKGLRVNSNTPKNADTLTECHNVAPSIEGLEVHDPVLDLTSYDSYIVDESGKWILGEDDKPMID